MKYFDYAATTPLYPEVLEILQKSFKNDFANPNALHSLGQDQRDELEEQRQKLKTLLKIKQTDNLYFTSGATESNNTVIQGISLKDQDVIFYSKADHASVVKVVEARALRDKIQAVEIKNSLDGRVDLEDLKKKLIIHKDKLALVCLTSVNNQTGAIIDIAEIALLIKTLTKAHIHVDAVQHFGKLPLFNHLHVDSISFSAHKVGGPKAIGALHLKDKHKIKPLILGGEQEHGFRSGTESLPLIKSFVLASEVSLKNSKKELETIVRLKDQCLKSFKESAPEIIYPFNESSPYVFSFLLPGISSDIILRHLEMKSIFISTTSACSSRIKGYNSTLAAVGIDEDLHKNFLRISFGFQTTKEDVAYLNEEFKKIWVELKKLIKK